MLDFNLHYMNCFFYVKLIKSFECLGYLECLNVIYYSSFLKFMDPSLIRISLQSFHHLCEWCLLNIPCTKDWAPQMVYQSWFFPAAYELFIVGRDWECMCSNLNRCLRIHWQAPSEWWEYKILAQLTVHRPLCSWECGHLVLGREFWWLCWDLWRCIWHWRGLFHPDFWSQTVRWA